MRKFYLEDHKGERIPLNNETGIFLYDPTGLGFDYSNDYGESGSGFFMRVKDGISQTEMSFALVFPPKEVAVGSDKDPYPRYRDFVDWIYAAEELYFVYCPYAPNEYYRKIEIQSVEKGELDKLGCLQLSTSILPLTPWYLPAPIHVSFGEEQENAMRYTFTYTEDLIYGVGSRDYTAEITAKGHIPSAMKVTFKGQVINPVLTLRGSANRDKVYGECKISETFSSDDTLVFSTAEQDSYVIKIDAQGNKTDLLDKIDITTNPFFRAPTIEPCELTLSGESILGKASMLLYVYYRGV